jgi:hypothetical protein
VALTVNVLTSLARSAVRMAAGEPAAAGLLSSSSLSLANGVLMTMMIKKRAVIGCAILSFAICSGTGALLVRNSRAQNSQPTVATPTRPAAEAANGAAAPNQPEIDPLLNELIQAARRRLLAQKDYYRTGRIAIDRYIAASSDLARVELLAAKGEAERRAIRRRHVQLAKEVEVHEKAELDAGRSTAPDTTEAHQARLQAEYDMMAGEKEDAEKASLLRRIAELERKVERLQKERGGSGQP